MVPVKPGFAAVPVRASRVQVTLLPSTAAPAGLVETISKRSSTTSTTWVAAFSGVLPSGVTGTWVVTVL